VRADVYGLGVVLFRAVTGELPFDACENRGILSHHLVSHVPPPSWLAEELPPSLDVLVLSATRKHPVNRYPTMSAFLADVEMVIAGKEASGTPVVVTPDGYQPTTEKGQLAFDTLSDEM
jgi:serine/threonine-protein kinase